MIKIALLACASLCLASQASAATPLKSAFDLNSHPVPMLGGAYLGMTLAAWKALPRASNLSAHAVPSCSDGSAHGNFGSARRPVVESHGPIVCSYLARYGAVILTQSLRLTPKYLARDPHYTFTDGRLCAIRFTSSVDSFGALTAEFTQAYGAPKQTLRDSVAFGSRLRLQRVQKIWRIGAQSLHVTDPAQWPDRLAVELTMTRPARVTVS